MLFKRLTKVVAVLAVGVTALAVSPLVGPSVSGAQESSPRVAEEFTLGLVEGELVVRDADEPYALENPTAISGTVDTENGAISGGSFATPQVNLRQDITNPLAASVFIDADFALVTPNSAVGSITHDGHMTFQASVRVNLHVDVQEAGGGSTIIDADCRTSPVNLEFLTTSPYDPDGDQKITVRDPNFSIPPVVEEPACDPLISGEINDQLAGPGHSLTLTLGGDISLPLPPGCETTAIMVASPEGEAELGTPVDLAATIAPVPTDPLCIEAAENGDVMTGSVHFFDGSTQIGSVLVAPDGTATLTTSAIPAGNRTLTAQYEGAFPFDKSVTAPLSYRITPNPTISATLPDYVRIDAAPTEFEVSVTNTGFGGAITNGRFDITFTRPPGFNAVLETDRLVLEYFDATETWVPVPLTPGPLTFNKELFGSIGPATGFALPVGEEITQRLRVQVLSTGETPSIDCGPTDETCPGLVDVAVEFVAVDAGSGLPAAVKAPAPDAITASAGSFTVIEATRRASAVAFGVAFTGGPISPYLVRQGGTISLPNLSVGPTLGTQRPTGHFEFTLDGQPLPIRRVLLTNAAPEAPPLNRVPIFSSGATNVTFDIPADFPPGAHQVTAKYSGNELYLPSENTTSFTVIEPVGVLYDCLSPGAINTRYRAYVESTIGFPLPLVRQAGSSVSLEGLSLRVLFSRDVLSQNNSRLAIAPSNGTRLVGPDLSIDLGFGPGGAGTAEGIARANGTRLLGSFAAPSSPVDEIMTFQSPSGSLVLDGAPGDVVPVTLDVIKMTGVDALAPAPVTCTPVGAPVQFGSITLSGNTLTVDPGDLAGQGDPVTLTSAVQPYTTGQVEFRDGSETIGVAPIADGLGSTVINDLPIGNRSLTAIFSGGFLAPTIVSNTVDLRIVSCPGAFAEEGNGAVVRLVYMRLLERCPDAAGYAHWKGLLDGGTSREHFARVISSSAEARRNIANDAYQTMLGRDGDTAGLNYWATYLLAHPYRQLLVAMGISPEYWELSGGTNEGFVTRTYQRLLLRDPDPTGLAHWVGRLDDGERKSVMLTRFTNLREPNQVVVTGSFNKILDRDPTPEEMAAQVTLYQADGNRSALYGRLIALEEFSDLAQTFPDF